MCALPTSRPKPRKLDLTAPRPPTPTPTADEARGDFFQTLMRFCLLCRSGSQTDVVKILNQWPDLPRTPRPLCGAARFGHVALIEYLLTQGFPLFSEHFSGSVPDSAAIGAEETGNTKVLELLLNHGWDISSGQPASMAFALQNEDVVRWFLEQGANPNGPYLKHLDLTVTTHAVYVAPLSVVKLLLDHGGVVTDTDAVAQAVIGHVKGIPDRLEVVEYLLAHDALIDACAFKNHERCLSLVVIEGLENGLHRATRAGKIDMVDLLLKRGADRNITTGRVSSNPDRWDLTALNIAEMNGFNDIASLLREQDVLR